MIVKKIALGNSEESYIEDRLTDKLNIIFSDDNNRGKTLVLQGFMYSIGNDPIFPSSFNYRDQYFYSELEINGETFEFLRKNNSLIVKTDGAMQLFNTARDFRYYFDKFIITLPRIIKDDRFRMVDFSLFYELFFIGQDNRSPATIMYKGQFNKTDFKNMVYSIAGIISKDRSTKSVDDLKATIRRLKLELRTVKRKISIIRSNPNIAEIASSTYDLQTTQSTLNKLSDINEKLTELRKIRQREINRKSKLDHLVSELQSLNRSLTEGTVKCGDCGSEKIVFSNNELNFEISNSKVRQSILDSISLNISQKEEIIEDFTDEINILQNSLAEELDTSPQELPQIMVYREQIVEGRNFDEEALQLSKDIKNLETQLKDKNTEIDNNKEHEKELHNKILVEMTRIYKAVEPDGNLVFDDIFTKKDVTFSGSEEQEYYFSRTIALNNILKHSFPIIVDSFRDGELSTSKEDKMLKIYKGLDKQIILTATLKKEEYSSNKYQTITEYNALDYSDHSDRKILRKENASGFMDILGSFEGLEI